MKMKFQMSFSPKINNISIHVSFTLRQLCTQLNKKISFPHRLLLRCKVYICVIYQEQNPRVANSKIYDQPVASILRQKISISWLSPWVGGKILFEKWSREAVKRLVKIIDVATEFKQSIGLFSSFCNSSLFLIIIQCRGVDRDFSRRLAWVRICRQRGGAAP